MNNNFNNTRNGYIDDVEEYLMSKVEGNVLDVGCGETARSSKLMLSNENIIEVTGFDPLLNGFKAEDWKWWDGFNFITVWYGSLDYIDKRKNIIKVLKKLDRSSSNLIIACHRRFIFPKNLYRLKWDWQSFKGHYNDFNGKTHNATGILIKQYIKGAKLFKKTSNYEYWIRFTRS